MVDSGELQIGQQDTDSHVEEFNPPPGFVGKDSMDRNPRDATLHMIGLDTELEGENPSARRILISEGREALQDILEHFPEMAEAEGKFSDEVIRQRAKELKEKETIDSIIRSSLDPYTSNPTAFGRIFEYAATETIRQLMDDNPMIASMLEKDLNLSGEITAEELMRVAGEDIGKAVPWATKYLSEEERQAFKDRWIDNATEDSQMVNFLNQMGKDNAEYYRFRDSETARESIIRYTAPEEVYGPSKVDLRVQDENGKLIRAVATPQRYGRANRLGVAASSNIPAGYVPRVDFSTVSIDADGKVDFVKIDKEDLDSDKQLLLEQLLAEPNK